MFRLFDSRAGEARPIRPVRPGQLHIFLASAPSAGQATADHLRAALLADLIRRAAERHHLHVTTWQREPLSAGLLAAAGLLNIHPPAHMAGPPDPPDVVVSADAAAGDAAGEGSALMGADLAAGHWIWPAPVHPRDVLPEDLAARGLDPLALRLALLRHHHQRPAALGSGALAAADASVRAWRRQVAAWANCASKPMSSEYVASVTEALDDDLSTPAAIAVLDALAGDEQIPPGSKFETFAYLDQFFGLDLARDVGR